MIDLHLHLDGSLSCDYLLSQAQADGVALPADTKEGLLPYLTVEQDCPNLNVYLEKFQLPLSVMQTEASLEHAVYDLIKRLAAQQITAAEIRFAPQLHCQRGLSQEAVVEAAVSGLKKGVRDFSIPCGLILCAMRIAHNDEANLKTVEMVKRYLGNGVLALDLAGAEALFSTSQFEALFRLAASYGLPFTIHAGEAAGPESIRKALEFGAMRIGHGVRCLEDEALTQLLIKKKIPLEICPSSNIHTGLFSDISLHPVLKLLDMGIMATVNTDNMTVSDTTLAQEFALLSQKQGMSEAQRLQLEQNAQKASFLHFF